MKNLDSKNNYKIGKEYNSKKFELNKAHHQIYSKDREYEIKKIKRKKLSATNNNFKTNKNNNYIVFRYNTFNKLKEKDIEKEKKNDNQIRKNQKEKLENDLSRDTNTLSFYYMNNNNTKKSKNNSNKKNSKLNNGSTSRKESKKISKNLSRENMKGGGNNFLQGGTQRKKISINDIENNKKKFFKLYDFNNSNKDDYNLINNTNDIIFTTANNINKYIPEKKNSLNNILLNSGIKFKGDKKVSLVDKYTNNLEFNKHHNQIKIDINNINNINNNNTNAKKDIIPTFKAQSNDKIIKKYNLLKNHSKENIVKNIKNIIIENSNKNNIDLVNRLKNENNIVYSSNITKTKNSTNKTNKEAITINQQIKKLNTNENYLNKKNQNLTISSVQNKNNIDINYGSYNTNNKKVVKNKNKDKLLSNINKNVNHLVNKNGKKFNSTKNNNNIYITYINNASSSSNADLPKIKNNFNYNQNFNKSNTNITEKLKNSSKKSINSINSITKLNTLQNEDIIKRLNYNNYKTKINFSSPKMLSLFERHNDKPHLRLPLSNNQKIKSNDKTYSPKMISLPKYIQTESNHSNNNIKNNKIYINRLDFFENFSISTRKNNIFSKINNNFKNTTNYINILNKRKLSAKIKNDKGNTFLKFIENKEKSKEKDMANLSKRRPRKIENEVNNILTEISNIYNSNKKNSFFNFGIKKSNHNNINNGIITTKLLDSFKNNKNNNNDDKNRKYSFINILKPKAISQQKRYRENNEKEDNSKITKDAKSLTFISKDNKNEKKKNISLLRKKRIIKLIHMMDEFNNSKSKSKSKSKRKNKSYNNTNNRGSSAIKERNNLNKFNINYFGEEDKIIDHVIKNDIIMFTIYIISKYNNNYKKIGLSKIKLYDKNNKEIFIVDSNSNISNNDGDENVNYLFNTKKYYSENKPFISEFKDNLYINFYVNFKKCNVIKYLKIFNYENKEENISPVKEIKICYGKKILYQGLLNINYFNLINISENNNIYKNNEFPIFIPNKKRGSSPNIKNCINCINNLYVNNFKKNTRSFSTFRASSGKKNNKFQKKQIIKTNSERNISNKVYNTKNIKNFKFISYNNTEIDNKTFNNKNTNGNICNTIAYNNNNDNSVNCIFLRERFISENNIRRENNFNEINESGIHKGINIKKFNLSYYNTTNNINYKDEDNEFISNSPYIKFKRIRLVLSSNYGHPNFIGLTGLEFYDINNKIIEIETAETIGALPKDLHTIYNNENDNRIFENIFNGENNVDDSFNMWITLFDINKDFPYIELSFNKYICISKIKIFNYNKKNELDICTKTIEVFLDNKYYNTIYLRQGIGDIPNDNIIQKENTNINNYNKINDDKNNKDNKNFCQEITFPINNDYFEKINKENNENKSDINIEYASNKYEQSYETPYMPNGQIIKFQLISNYYKGKALDNNIINSNTNSANNIFIKNYNYIGIYIVKILDENGNDIITKNNIKYKIISNKEMIISDKHKIILKCSPNEDDNNNLFFLFDQPINISYIEINPFCFLNNDKLFLNNVKEIKIFCDTSIIFEGEIYNHQPTAILFTSNDKISKNININFLTKKNIKREVNEIQKDDCYSLVFKI